MTQGTKASYEGVYLIMKWGFGLVQCFEICSPENKKEYFGGLCFMVGESIRRRRLHETGSLPKIKTTLLIDC